MSSSFCFSQVEHDEIMKEINSLKTNKTTQSTDTPTKLIKENTDIFWRFYFYFLIITIAFPVHFFQTPSKMQ